MSSSVVATESLLQLKHCTREINDNVVIKTLSCCFWKLNCFFNYGID